MRAEAYLILAATTLALPAFAEEEGGLADIDVGSTRIGGPGTARQQAAAAAAVDDEELTEANLPKLGDKRRLPGLQMIARRYARGSMWSSACDRYDQIVEESGAEAMETPPDAKEYAAKSYLECATAAFTSGDFDKAEALLKKSEKYGPSGYKHEGIRRKIQRETYRKAFVQGAIDKAVDGFRAYHKQRPDEDERIWLGNELSSLAMKAHREKNVMDRDHYIALAKEIAPQNPELKKLLDEMESSAKIFPRVAMFGGAIVAISVVLGQLMRLRSRARAGKEPIEDDD